VEALLREKVAWLEQELAASRSRESRLLRLLETVLRVPAPRPATPMEPPRGTPREPDPSSLQGRILAYLRASARPQFAHQIQRALALDRRPHRELSKLCERGLATKTKPSQYVATVIIPPVDEDRDGDDTNALSETMHSSAQNS
jgi:hypothetical protein